MTQITIRPNTDNQTNSFEPERMLHNLEYKQVLNILKTLKENGESYDPTNKVNFRRVHNTITLSGSRGSGKTSFLMSLKKDIESTDELKKDYVFLEIIDPTLIEEKGHVFLNVVARIKSLIDDEIDKGALSLTSEPYSNWEKILKKLAAGLPMLDGINGGLDPSDWNDTTYVMMDGLRRVDGANNLEIYFHQYISYSLKILAKKCFIITFDDVDTDFAKGWPVLEVLRKYITSPQIITALSGDLDLYSFLVRKKQWKNFGKTLLKNEYDKGEINRIIYSNEYPQLVEKLESQYLLKLLKPELRIVLSTIGSKLQNKNIDIVVEYKEGGSASINDVYRNSLAKAWNINANNTQMSYASYFLSLPIRTQISLLNAFSKNLGDEDEYLFNLSKDICSIFHSELRTSNVDVWEFVNGYGATNIFLLRFLTDNKILDEASQLFPKLSNPTFNGAVTALGGVLTERMYKSPFEIFDHIIRVSNIVAKAEQWEFDKVINEPNIIDFIYHSKSLYDYGLKKISSLQGAYIASHVGKFTPKNEGLIGIKTLQLRLRKTTGEGDTRIDELFDGSKPVEKILALLPAFGAQDIHGNNTTFYSFFNILAAIGDLITQDKLEIRNEFVRIGQFRQYPVFTNSNQRFQIEEDENVTFINSSDSEEADSKDTDPDIIDSFITEIFEWTKNKHIKIPPYLIGRIMVRTNFAFARISATTCISEQLHRYLVVFLNAVLVEELMENVGNAKLRLTNPTSEDSFFEANYKLNKEDHPLFDFMLSCPIIKAYLNPSLLEALKIETNFNIFEELSKIKQNFRSSDFKQMNRVVRDTQNDADLLVDYLLSIGISKDIVNIEDVDSAIRTCFKNRRVHNDMKNGLFEKVKNNTIW